GALTAPITRWVVRDDPIRTGKVGHLHLPGPAMDNLPGGQQQQSRRPRVAKVFVGDREAVEGQAARLTRLDGAHHDGPSARRSACTWRSSAAIAVSEEGLCGGPAPSA